MWPFLTRVALQNICAAFTLCKARITAAAAAAAAAVTGRDE